MDAVGGARSPTIRTCMPRAPTCCAGWADAAEAADAYRRAVALTENDAERRFLERQLATLSAPD